MFYVYYLLDPESRDILYVGRSTTPLRRLWAFKRKHQKEVVFGFHQRHSDFGRACQAELSAITKHRPVFNKKLISTRGSIGCARDEAYRQKLSAALKGRRGSMTGRTHSAETRKKISESNIGKFMPSYVMSEERKAKIGAANKGKLSWAKGRKQSPEHTAAIKQARLKQEQEKRARK